MVGFGIYWFDLVLSIILLFTASSLNAVVQQLQTAGVNINARSAVVTIMVIAYIIAYIIAIGLTLMYFFFVWSHRKKPKKTYITVLLVFICIAAFFNLISLFMGSYMTIISLAACGCGMAACIIQMKMPENAVPPAYGAPIPPPTQYPYGGPYAQNNPYVQNPQGNPYAQNPNNNPYAQNPNYNPYAQNPNSNPYAQNAGTYSQNPSNNPYAPNNSNQDNDKGQNNKDGGQ